MDPFKVIVGIFLACGIICLVGTFVSALKEDEYIEIIFATLTIIAMFALVARTFLEMMG